MPKFQVLYTIEIASKDAAASLATVNGTSTFLATSDTERATILQQHLDYAIVELRRQVPTLGECVASYSMLTVMPSLD
jgi:hypothetical protein